MLVGGGRWWYLWVYVSESETGGRGEATIQAIAMFENIHVTAHGSQLEGRSFDVGGDICGCV